MRLVVLADSLAFTGQFGPLLPDDPSLYPNVAAVALGACIVEKHLTLSRGMAGPDHAASCEPRSSRGW